jgi:hypothetical protein
MMFEDFLFLCGVCICAGLCVMFGALLGFGLFYWLREVFAAGAIEK